MQLRQLQYFMGVARLGSFSAASEDLNVSQPALGLQVKKLEDYLQIRLLERHSRGVSLTPAGKLFKEKAQAVLDSVELAEQAIAEFRGAVIGKLSLAVTPTAARALVPDMIAECSLNHPELKLEITQHLSGKVMELVNDDVVDIGLAYDPDVEPGFFAKPLFTESLYIVGPTDRLGNSSAPITLDEAVALPLVLERTSHNMRQVLERVANRHHHPLQNVLEIDGINIRREMLVRHNLCTITPYGLFLEELHANKFSARRIIQPNIERTLFVFCREVRLEIPSVKLMLELLDTMVAARIKEQIYKWRLPNTPA